MKRQPAAFISLMCLFLGEGASEAAILRWAVPNTPYGYPPQNITNVQAMAAGESHALALRSDGTVMGWGWGDTNNGQLNLPSGLSNVTALAAGGYHTLARRANGTVVAWGAGDGSSTGNDFGQSMVPAGLSNVVAVAAGEFHSLALKGDGSVVNWGGDGMAGSVPGGLTGVIAVAAGYYFNMALRSNGTVVAWGTSPEGIARPMVPPGLTNVIAISAGRDHALALRSNGTVACWELNDIGASLTNVPAGLHGVVAIAAGPTQSLALRNDGSVAAWGLVPPPAVVTGVTAIAAGPQYSLASGVSASMTPLMLQSPFDQNVNAGGTAGFQAQAAGGSAPLVYQWRFNGIPITGATKSSFSITNVAYGNAGNYSAVVSNFLGTATSGSAKLFVSPGNDNFRDAQQIPPGGGRTLGSNVGTTKEPFEADHAGNPGGSSVWYTWQAPMNSGVTLDTIGSSFDTLLAVYTGNTVSNLTLIAADDDGANYQLNSLLTFIAKAGVTYRIAVDGYYYAQGSIVLNLNAQRPVITPGLTNGVFGFESGGPVGGRIVVEASTNLLNWVSIGTNVIPSGGVFSFKDLQTATTPRRFFRVRLE